MTSGGDGGGKKGGGGGSGGGSSGDPPPEKNIVDLDSLPVAVTSPIVLFQVKESFRQAVTDAMSIYYKEDSDGRTNCAEVLAEDHVDWKEHNDIKAQRQEHVALTSHTSLPHRSAIRRY